MKKLNVLLFLLGILLFVTPVYSQEQERILEFRSDITVNRDNSIDITEEIHYYPSEEISRHGLEWQIPYVYSVKAFRRPTELKINDIYYYPASDTNDVIQNLYSRRNENGWAILRIGDPDSYISGEHIFIIDYTLKYSGISFFEEHEEVYLNIIGPGWNIPIENSSATLTLPEEIEEIKCFTGPDGSEREDCEIKINDKDVDIKPSNTLQPFEGYTVAIKQPLGTFDDTTKQQALLVLLANIGILLPIPVGIYLFSYLLKKYRNEKLTVIPQYKPQENMDALSSGILFSSISTNKKNVTAVLIELAIKGYYKIREYEKNKYEFVKLNKDTKELPNHLSTFVDSIFSKGEVVQLKKLTDFPSMSNKASVNSKLYLKELNALSTSKETKKIFILVFSILLLFFLPFGLLSLFISLAAFGWLVGISLSLILVIIFALKIDIRTEKGNEIYHYLLGLRMYIDTAEKHRIEFHNDPKKYNEVFEKLLPYAIIFGLEKKWAKQFEDIYTTQPDWYEGKFTTFNTIYFANSLGSFNRTVTASSNPQNSYSSSGGHRSGGWSSGGSGFGGGGSSGGGGGGSGGGGW